MRTCFGGYARPFEVFCEEPGDAPSRNAAAEMIEEYGDTVHVTAALDLAAYIEPIADCVDCNGPEYSDAFALAFASHRNTPGVQVEIVDVDTDEFADPQAGGIERFEDRAVTLAQSVLRVRCSQ